jgi:hypothetical protein
MSALVGCGTSYTATVSNVNQPTGLPASSTIAAGTDPSAVVSCDLTGNGTADLAVADAYGNSIIILLGAGSGTFTAGTPVTLASTDLTPNSIVCADFNGDGKPDLAVTNLNSGTVSVWLGDGKGTFTSAGPSVLIPLPPTSSPIAASLLQPTFIASANLTASGHTDLVVESNVGLTILLGNGDGTFKASSIAQTSNSGPVAIADFTGSGHQDIALVSASAKGVVIFPGNGDGTFAPSIQSGITISGYIATADFNGDKKPDLIVGPTVFLGNGNGTFTPGASVGISGSYIATGNFQGNGNIGLAVLAAGSQELSVLNGNGDGTFAAPTTYVTGQAPTSVAVGAFTGSSTEDFAVANSFNGNVTVYLTK